jgi:protein involved in polysaccharide export with SLBB domain
MNRRGQASVIVTMLILSLSACAPVGPTMPASDLQAARTAEYTLGPGDKLHISVFGELQLTGDYAVTSAGNVSLPLVGDVGATGKTVGELQAAVEAKLANGYVTDPHVGVQIIEYRPFFILGEVNKPGAYPFTVGLTLEQAVATAGGYTVRANKHVVFVKRSGAAQELSVDTRAQTVSIKPGDTIRIGERYF